MGERGLAAYDESLIEALLAELGPGHHRSS